MAQSLGNTYTSVDSMLSPLTLPASPPSLAGAPRALDTVWIGVVSAYNDDDTTPSSLVWNGPGGLMPGDLGFLFPQARPRASMPTRRGPKVSPP